MVTKEKRNLSICVNEKKEGRTERCGDLGEELKCMRCGKNNKETFLGSWMRNQFNNTLKNLGNRHNGGHDLQRFVDANGITERQMVDKKVVTGTLN